MTKVLITGATSGIGESAAKIFAKNGYSLILCGRRKDRLETLEAELSKLVTVKTLCFDVRDREIVLKMIKELPSDWQDIDILINNAGNAHGLSKLQEGDLEDWDAMMDINVKGLLYVSKAVLPGMVKRNRGHVINIGSIAGKEVYPSGNVYCASKYAVDAITKGMRIDLNAHNIRVGAVNPGLVETEFSEVRFKGDKDRAKDVYEGMKPLSAEDIADILFFIVTRPSHVNIADLLVLPSAQASAGIVHRS